MNNYSAIVGQSVFEQDIEGKRYKVTVTDVKRFTYEPIEINIEEKVEGSPIVVEEVFTEEEKTLLKDNSSDYKLETALKKIEKDNFIELSSYVATSFPKIMRNRKDTITSLTDKLLFVLYDTCSEKAIKESMGRIRAIVNRQTDNNNYRGVRFTRIRTVLKKRFGYGSDIVIYHKKFGGQTNEQFAERELEGKVAMEANLENRIEIDEKDALIILNKMSSSNNVFDRIIVLQLATGARFIEAVRVSSFSESPVSFSWIHIKGIAKQGNEQGENFEMNRPIFGLKSSDEVIYLASLIRDQLYVLYPHLSELTNTQVSTLLIGPVNRRLTKLKIPGVKTSHILRKLYAQLTYNQLPKNERNKMDRHLWVSRVLGHASIKTAGNYSNVKVHKAELPPPVESVGPPTGEADEADEADVPKNPPPAPTPPPTPPPTPEPSSSLALRATPPPPPVKNPRVVKQVLDIQTFPSGHVGTIVTLTNRNGNKVEIHDRVPGSRGNAMARAEDIMIQLNQNNILITELLLKNNFKIGSKTVSNLSELKKALNEKLPSRRDI